MKSFLSLLSERREMRASEKCHPGIGCRIKPRSSHTEGVCATDAPLHIQKKKQKKKKKKVPDEAGQLQLYYYKLY
jgi:hypothetical protein